MAFNAKREAGPITSPRWHNNEKYRFWALVFYSENYSNIDRLIVIPEIPRKRQVIKIDFEIKGIFSGA